MVETGYDTPHPIEHVGDVPLSHVGQKGKLMNVLHVLTIMKNLMSVGQIVDQGMQVRFTHLGCFIEEEGQVIAHKGVETGGCSSSTPMALAPQCSQKNKKSSRISTSGTSG